MERNITFSEGSHTLRFFVTSAPQQEHVYNPDFEETGNIWCDIKEIFLIYYHIINLDTNEVLFHFDSNGQYLIIAFGNMKIR